MVPARLALRRPRPVRPGRPLRHCGLLIFSGPGQDSGADEPLITLKMKENRLEIKYSVYGSLDELEPEDRKVAEAAIAAQKSSYAPHSHFNVGAAVLLADGSIVPGSNQENDAYPSGLCAERTAMFAAAAMHPGVPFVSLAVVGGHSQTICDAPATPCGACRQVMAEYQKLSGRPLTILMVGRREIWKFVGVESILPFIFDSL